MGSYERTVGSPVPFFGSVTATATCSAGKKVLGGGHMLTANSWWVLASVIENRPTADDVWTVKIEDWNGLGGGTLTAYALCL
jgi:hypothetical protein